MIRISLVWPLLALLGLSGCGSLVQDVSIDKIPAVSPKMVVQAFISPQDTMLAVYVDRPTAVLGLYSNSGGYYTSRYAIQNAVVDVSDGNRTVRLSKRTGQNPASSIATDAYYGVSTREFPVVAGRTYTLTASAPGYPSVSAQCTVPSLVQPTQILLDSSVTTTAFGQPRSTYTARLYWRDPAGVRNYYRLGGLVTTAMTYRTSYGSTKPPRDTTYIQRRILIVNGKSEVSDQNTDGQAMTGSADLLLFANPQNPERPLVFSLSLSNLGESFYQYLEAIGRQREQGNNPFSEPVLIPSNIQNGLGCFGGYNQATLTLKAK